MKAEVQRWLVVVIFTVAGFVASSSHGTAQFGIALNYGWVDPVNGADVSGTMQVNDIENPYKSLQFAIDEMYEFIVTNSTSTSNIQGIIYCMPGLYGDHGTSSSGDSFPIIMRDRVHVRGLGARRCVIRGTGEPTTTEFYSPTQEYDGGTEMGEILVHYVLSTDCDVGPDGMTLPPWAGAGDTAETLDGFTFQGGAVQVLIGANGTGFGGMFMEYSAKISNCLFDMRNGFVPNEGFDPIDGPLFGIQMWRAFNRNTQVGMEPGYHDHKVLIANNTFIFGEWDHVAETWLMDEAAKVEAVGIIDVTDGCTVNPTDADPTNRGLGGAGIINNLFRTIPRGGAKKPYAMLGIDESDTLTIVSPNLSMQTNVFATDRVGNTNGTYWSRPVTRQVAGTPVQTCGATFQDAWDCRPNPSGGTACGTAPGNPCGMAPLPVPVLPLYDGVAGTDVVDPLFVGEYVNVIVNYRFWDWRLLPNSPLENQGYSVPGGSDIVMANGNVYAESSIDDLRVFKWDGESHGNPRVVDGAIDVGFDEVHDFILTASWTNHSNSHNFSTFLNPVGDSGAQNRFFIVRNNYSDNRVTVFGAQKMPRSQTEVSPENESKPFESPAPERAESRTSWQGNDTLRSRSWRSCATPR